MNKLDRFPGKITFVNNLSIIHSLEFEENFSGIIDFDPVTKNLLYTDENLLDNGQQEGSLLPFFGIKDITLYRMSLYGPIFKGILYNVEEVFQEERDWARDNLDVYFILEGEYTTWGPEPEILYTQST
jgi:hypothetical protein